VGKRHPEIFLDLLVIKSKVPVTSCFSRKQKTHLTGGFFGEREKLLFFGKGEDDTILREEFIGYYG